MNCIISYTIPLLYLPDIVVIFTRYFSNEQIKNLFYVLYHNVFFYTLLLDACHIDYYCCKTKGREDRFLCQFRCLRSYHYTIETWRIFSFSLRIVSCFISLSLSLSLSLSIYIYIYIYIYMCVCVCKAMQ